MAIKRGDFGPNSPRGKCFSNGQISKLFVTPFSQLVLKMSSRAIFLKPTSAIFFCDPLGSSTHLPA